MEEIKNTEQTEIMRVCKDCHEEKNITDYYKYKYNYRTLTGIKTMNGTRTNCKICFDKQHGRKRRTTEKNIIDSQICKDCNENKAISEYYKMGSGNYYKRCKLCYKQNIKGKDAYISERKKDINKDKSAQKKKMKDEISEEFKKEIETLKKYINDKKEEIKKIRYQKQQLKKEQAKKKDNINI